MRVRVLWEGASRGDRAMEMYFLLSGSVRLCRNPPDQNTTTAATRVGDDERQKAGVGDGVDGTVEAGDIFGELALFPGAHAQSDAEEQGPILMPCTSL